MLRNISITDNCISVWLSSNTEQCRPKFNVQFITFHTYKQDIRLCVYKAFKHYTERTNNVRENVGTVDVQLLISYIKPHKAACKETVA